MLNPLPDKRLAAKVAASFHSEKAGFGNKPDGKLYASGWEPGAFSPYEVARKLDAGMAISSVFRNNYRLIENFLECGWLGADFDTCSDFDAAVAACKERGAAILYNTPSHKPEKPKFRAIFLLETPITDADLYRKANKALINQFRGMGIDTGMHDPARFFYGCEEGNISFEERYISQRTLDQWVSEYEASLPKLKILEPVTPTHQGNQPTAYGLTALEKLCEEIRTAQEGQRHERAQAACVRLAGLIKGDSGLTVAAWGELEAAWDSLGVRRDKDEFRKMRQWGEQKAQPENVPETKGFNFNAGNARKVDTVTGEVLEDSKLPYYELNGLGNSHRFVDLVKGRVLYVKQWGGYYLWSGKHWQKDETGLAMTMAKKVVAIILQEAAQQVNEGKEDQAKATMQWAKQTGNFSKIDEILKLSIDELPARPSDFDRNPMLLNLNNGTLNLLTGKLEPHEPGQLITKLAPVDYDPQAKCPGWLNFLNQIMGSNQTLVSYLKRAVGYSLTGETNEQCLFFLYGTGANGKSTFLEVLMSMMGDYSQATNPTSFLAKDSNSDGPRNDLAKLAGARMAKAVEAESGRRWAESLIKELTGGDTITARFLHKEEFSFKPQFKLWFAANHKPVVRGQDTGIWRRMRLIPFTMAIPESAQDKKLSEKLKSELPGVLNWAIEGCLEWQKTGLKDPKEVLEATKQYQIESDSLLDFTSELCDIGKADKHKVTLSELYKAYFKWAEDEKVKPMGKQSFSQALQERKFLVNRGNYGKATVFGLSLKVEVPEQPTNEETLF